MYTYAEKTEHKMNERIKELALQAGAQGIVNRDFIDVEKFAKLIIAETCKILAENKEFRAAVLVGRHFPLWK
jgi:hypothetical protein